MIPEKVKGMFLFISGGPQRDRFISPGWFTPVLAQKLDEALQNAVVTTTQPFIVCPIVCVFTVWVWANHNQGHPQGGRNDGTWEGCKKEQEGGKEAESGGNQETGRQWWMSTIHPWSITHPPIIYHPSTHILCSRLPANSVKSQFTSVPPPDSKKSLKPSRHFQMFKCFFPSQMSCRNQSTNYSSILLLLMYAVFVKSSSCNALFAKVILASAVFGTG